MYMTVTVFSIDWYQ